MTRGGGVVKSKLNKCMLYGRGINFWDFMMGNLALNIDSRAARGLVLGLGGIAMGEIRGVIRDA